MFAHIFFLYHPELNKGGLFGYEYWSVFFASMMYPVLFFIFGYLLQRLSNNYIDDKKGLRLANIVIGALYFFSLFYLLITFFPYRNSFARIGLEPFWYYVVACGATVFVACVLVYLPKSLKAEIRDLRLKVSSMQKTLSNYLDLLMKWQYRTDDPNEFRDDLISKTKDSGLVK